MTIRPAMLIGLTLLVILIIASSLIRGDASSTNSPPVAVDDQYTLHGSLVVPGPGLLKNDSDPDHDPIHMESCGQATHGTVACNFQHALFTYQPNHPYVGSDSFTYQVCDPSEACATGTVVLNVVNSPPVAIDDAYNVHGHLFVPGSYALRQNDNDPDHDPIHVASYTPAPHGNFTYSYTYGSFTYVPDSGYTGTDSITYQLCDNLGLCANATASFNVVNQPPLAVDDLYVVRGSSFALSGPKALRENDSDPDGDQFSVSSYTRTSHGTVFYSQTPGSTYGSLSYTPTQGYLGSDSFTYQECDILGACSSATVTFLIIGDGENNGVCSRCSGGAIAVGQPVNVTNGNMYLQQTDYQLPGVGYPIAVTRTYNSAAQQTGSFGRGWSSEYDESITSYDNNLARLNRPDGRAIYLARATGSANALAALEGDFHGSLVKNAGSGFTLTMTDGSLHQFNVAGKLTLLADRLGNQTTLTYDGGGKLTSVTDPFGRVLSFTNNANGRVLSISDTMGTVATYTYGGGNQLLSVTYPDNSAFRFTYDANNRLTLVTDNMGNIVESHNYDSQGRAITSERQGGVEHYSLKYVSATQTDVTDALSHVTKYTIDKSRGRNVVTRAQGLCSCPGSGGSQVQTWTYDSKLNLTAKTDALNHTVTFTYDSDGNRLTQTDATGTVMFTYNQFGEVLTHTDQLNGLTTNSYDSSGNLLTTKDALENTTTFTYSARGQVLTATDARSKVTTFTYDALGNLTQAKDANNITTFYFYDARGRLTKVRDGLSRSTLYAYDLAGRLNKVTHPDLSFVNFTYDLAGRPTTVTDERGNPTNYAYDSAYRLTRVTDALSHATNYTYDAMSNLTGTTDALSRVTNYNYDDFNRLVTTTYPNATAGAPRLFESLTYDAAGNVTQRTDTAGRVTHYAYDDLNRLAATTDADNKITSFEYDALSRTTAVVDALNQHYQFAYDALGRQTAVTRGGLTMSYQYDAVGNRTQRTDYNGTATNYAYDNLNRMTTISYPTRTVTYSYMVTGQLSRASNENGSVYIGYDNRYRVSSLSDPFYYGISYNYDTAGNRTKLSLNGAAYATYTYDTVNRLTSLEDAENQNFPHTYDVVNRLTARSAPNGITSSYDYDGLDRLIGLRHAATANVLVDNQYAYNDASNIATWNNASGNHAYGYDAVDRLTSAVHNAQWNETYSYDSVGNRASSHLSAGYAYQPFNKLTNSAIGSYSYDNNGNLLTRTDSLGTTTFTWNEEDQLTQVTLPGGLSVNYKYDGLGHRIQRTTSAGANERYVYDGQDVLLDLNADWSVATKYLNGPGIDNHLRQSSSTSGISYFLTDHLGSTAGLTDDSGSLLEQLTYDSFGNSVGSSRTRYGYTGRERDPDTGLMYYRARWYDPQLGRFISEDPIVNSPNLYPYVDSNPLNASDPQGQWPSQFKWKYHQTITRRALGGIGVDPGDIGILANEQGPFDLATQDESQAHKHAMCRRGENPALCRRRANQYIREQICYARKLAARGNRVGAMKLLSHAMHTLQDSTSPAHANFQEAWPNTYKDLAKHRGHYWNEWFDPGAGSEADLITIRGWKYFTGEEQMPADFFGNVYDLPNGRRGYFNSRPSPDNTDCDCYN